MNLHPICPPAARITLLVISACPTGAHHRRRRFAASALRRYPGGRPFSRPNGVRERGCIRALIAAALAIFTLTVAAAASLPRPATIPRSLTAEMRDDRILVRPKPGVAPSVLQRTYAAFGCTVLESYARIGNLTILQMPADADVRTVIGLLEKTGAFTYVEPDYVGHALALPNDPRFPEQWSLNNPGGSGGTAGADIKAVSAWDIAHDASNIVVAVVDSGIRSTHQDLAANLWINPGESGSGRENNGVDDDGDGYVDDVNGVNVLNHSGNAYDDWGHGTHVAGIIGAAGNNALGVSGVAWRVKLMACKFIDSNGNYAVSDAVAALDYARQHGANVVLAAWGGYSFTSSALRDAVMALRDAGIIVVAAAGNSSTNNDTTPLYPASYEYANVIAVAASDRNDALAAFSDYGAATVDLAAPGVDILSCTNTSDADYRTLSGTSMASAEVAGAVALVWSHFPTDSYQQVIHRIVATVDPAPALAGKVASGGRLDLAAALATAELPVVSSAATASATVGTAFSYQIAATGSPTNYAATNLTGTGLSLDPGTGAIWGIPAAAGVIASQLTAMNAAGPSAPSMLTITVNAVSADTTAPTISGFQIDLSTATNSTASYVVAFTEPVTGVTADDFVMNTQGTATAIITGITDTSRSTYRVSFDFAGNSGSIQMAIKTSSTGIADAAGNAFGGGGFAASDVVSLIAGPAADLIPPTIDRLVAGAPTASAVNFTLTFSEPVTGVTADDFVLLEPAALTASIGGITSDTTHTIYTIPVTYSGRGALQLLVLGGADASIRDAATNWFVGGPGQLSPTVTLGTTASVPVVTSAATDTGDVGIAFIYQITATGSPTTYAATNLQGTGLALDPSTGLISGTPIGAGTIVSQLTATNTAGPSVPGALTITVRASPVVPVITSGSSVSTVLGAAFTYQITATGSPTTYAATNLTGTGLGLNSNTGVISGAPTTAGTITSRLNASNATGTSAPVTLSITINAATPPAPVVAAGHVDATLGVEITFDVVATNHPTQFTISSGPAWLSINTATGEVSGTPTASGTFSASVNASNAGGTGSGTITLVVSGRPQAVDFSAPTSAIIIGQPIRLGATASSGLPVTYSVMSGYASLNGDTLTLLARGPVVVRATQAGDAAWSSASAEAILTAQQAAQVIVAQVTPQPVTADATINLSATTSSGLPVGYELVSGPGVLKGDTLTFNGATGTVVVRVTQSGNNAFTAAASVDLTFVVTARGEQVYLGKVGTDDFAAAIAADNSHGTFAMRRGATGEPLVAQFVVAADGSFSTTIAPVASSMPSTSPAQADGPPRTVSGVVANGLLSGALPERDATFTATIQGPTGHTAPYAGLYTATIPGSASGTAYLFAGTNGQAYALVVIPSMVMSGSGTVAGDGTVNITTGSGERILAVIDPTSSTVSGTLQTAQVTLPFAGLSASTLPTDRLVNVSARSRVSGNDSTHASIAGFVIAGVAPKPVLIRAVGPTLALFGLPSPLPDPQLQLFDQKGDLLGVNNGWGGDGAISNAGHRVGAFSLNAGSRDAALVVTLAPGAYTAQVTSANSGLALIEVYDMAGPADPSRQLVNISTRGFVGHGEDVLIGGFAVTGNQPKRVLIRAIGPSLAGFGVPGALSDPRLGIYDAKGTVVAQNDNWSSPQAINGAQFPASAADIVAADTASGAFPLVSGSADAAVIITLNPGTYSAVVTGAGGGSGAALIEVYEIPAL